MNEVAATGSYVGARAIVIGAGISGLAAARALADSFEQVIVVERDKLSDKVEPRSGVPQSRHPHAILCGAVKELEDLFPDFGRDILGAGGLQLNFGSDLCAELPHLGAFPRRDWEAQTYALSRPLIELLMRRRVERCSNVIVRDQCRALEIFGSPDGSIVTGVLSETGPIAADLVVDASSSSGSLTFDYLRSKRMAPPHQTTLSVDIRYATAVFAMPERNPNDYKAYVTFPEAPESVRYGYLLPAENKQWQMLLIGRGEDAPPSDLEGFMEFARGLETTTIYNAVKGAELVRPITRFGVPQSQWRRFGSLDIFPRGLLVMGDAVCRFNPAYGQGMTVALQEASALRRLLETHAGERDSIGAVGTDFRKEVEDLVETPWGLSSLLDLVYPQTVGERPADLEDRLKFMGGLQRLAFRDSEVHKLLLEVQHLVKPGYLLEEPELKARVEEEMAATAGA